MLIEILALGQSSKIPELESKLLNKNSDTVHIKILVDLCWEYRNVDADKSIEYGTKAISFSRDKNKEEYIPQIYNLLGVAYRNKNDFSYALINYEKALKFALKDNNTKEIAYAYNNIGGIYQRQSNYSYALDNILKSLSFFEQLNNKRGIAFSCMNISDLLMDQGKHEEALKYILRVIKIREETGKTEGLASAYTFCGNAYLGLLNYNKALDYHLKALKLNEKTNLTKGIAMSCASLGNVYTKLSKFETANKYYLRSVFLLEEFNEEFHLSIVLRNIGDYYSAIGRYNVAQKYFEESIEMAQNIGAKSNEVIAYKHLSELYEKQNKYKQALLTKDIYFTLKDSIFSAEQSKILNEMRVKYETDKKEAENVILRKDQALNKSIIRKQSLIGFGIGFLLFLMVILSLVLLRTSRFRKKTNRILTVQKREIRKKNKNITDSIEYAKQIQKAILPNNKLLTLTLPYHFIFYEPKDIVSGDFYWVNKNEEIVYVVVGDCTGHGVPGAFMSMLGVTLLNEIVNKNIFIKASDILEELREKIKTLLQQTGSKNDASDGIDLALCKIDITDMSMQFAGANNNMYIIRKDQNVNENLLIELKGDYMPIGIYIKEESFRNTEFQLVKDDRIYLFTDGYIDQFGGENNTKFLRSNFNKLLISIADKPMAEQKEILAKTFYSWKRSQLQVDDVLVMGVKF
jgi:serine phosphatase RsbU (regulator of sigma subunit)